MSAAPLFLLAALATSLGLVNLFGTSTGSGGILTDNFTTQLLAGAGGIAAFIVGSSLSPARLRAMARPAWLIAIATMLVGIIAMTLGQTWATALPLPALAAIAVPMVLANEAARPNPIRGPLDWMRIAVATALPAILLTVWGAPGAAMLVLATAITVLWTAGVSRSFVVLWALMAAVTVPLGIAALSPAHRSLASGFLTPAATPSGDGYSTLQSLYAVGSGGWLGNGWGAGTQGRLGFLHGHDSSFAVAHMAEEWGAIGTLFAMTILFGIVLAGLQVAERCRDRFSSLLALALVVWFGLQCAAHVGGALGLLPPLGLSLPFFSSGAISLLSAWMCLGMLASLRRRPSAGLAPGAVAYGPNESVPSLAAILAR